VLVVAVVALLLVAPFFLSSSLINAAVQMLIAALFACAFNLLCGQAGMLSFGHSAFFGIGTFATIHAMNALGGAGLLPTPLLPLIGALGGLLLGIVAGWFSTKRTGAYFAMITLAIAELLHALAPQLKESFGGEAGISSMRMPAWGLSFGSNIEVYYLTLAWVLTSLLLLYLFTLTPLGRLTLGLRENSARLRFLGYNVHRLSVVVFALSAMFSGIAGGLQALTIEAANYVVFDAGVSAAVVLNSYIGGVNVFLGPAVGAAIMTFFGSAVSNLTRAWLLYQGIIFIAVMVFVPTGVTGIVKWWVDSYKTVGLLRLLPITLLYLAGTALLAGGVVFTVEMLQRFFSHDYRSLAELSNAAGWPPIALFRQAWAPLSLVTWLVPLTQFIFGIVLVRRAHARLLVLKDFTESLPASASPGPERGLA
jgi:branched-chain amino acid transport system permease protein